MLRPGRDWRASASRLEQVMMSRRAIEQQLKCGVRIRVSCIVRM